MLFSRCGAYFPAAAAGNRPFRTKKLRLRFSRPGAAAQTSRRSLCHSKPYSFKSVPASATYFRMPSSPPKEASSTVMIPR